MQRFDSKSKKEKDSAAKEKKEIEKRTYNEEADGVVPNDLGIV
jgi:hypothetical protein